MARIVGPFLLTVAQFAVAIGLIAGLQALLPTDSSRNQLFVFVTVIFAVTAVTWGYWQLTGNAWGISAREAKRRREEDDDPPSEDT